MPRQRYFRHPCSTNPCSAPPHTPVPHQQRKAFPELETTAAFEAGLPSCLVLAAYRALVTKHESPMIQRWWASAGIAGSLAEEFTIVRRQAPIQVRRLDAIVVLDDGPPGRVIDRTMLPSLEERDLLVVQAKASKLSEGLCGQAIGSIFLAERHRPASVRSVIICAADDPVLRPMVEAHGVEVVVVDVPTRSAAKVNPDRTRLARWAAEQQLPIQFDVRMAGGSRVTAHALVAHDGQAAPSRWTELADRVVEVLVAKQSGAREGSSFGMSPVGYALMHRELALAAGARSAEARILTTTVDPVMLELAERFDIAVELTP